MCKCVSESADAQSCVLYIMYYVYGRKCGHIEALKLRNCVCIHDVLHGACCGNETVGCQTCRIFKQNFFAGVKRLF